MNIRSTRAGKGLHRFEEKFSLGLDALLEPIHVRINESRISLYAGLSNFLSSDEIGTEKSSAASTDSGSGIAISIKGLVKVFGPEPKSVLPLIKEGLGKEEIKERTKHILALNGIDLDIKEGELFVIMGLSGCGKSTLERCLNRLIEPTDGSVTVHGVDITALNPTELRNFRRKHISMVFQNFGLLPHKSILDNVAFGLEVQGIELEERLEKARRTIKLVGLEGYESYRTQQLSGGMKQRVGLARALANDPDILLMDEAFSALDPLIRRNMQDELLELQGKVHKTIVFVTHDLDEAMRLGDRIAIMKNGSIVQIGTSEEILTNPADDYVASFIDGIDRSKVISCESVMQPAEPLIPSKTGLRSTLLLMRDSGKACGFVIDKDRRFIGMVWTDALASAVKENRTLEETIVQDIRSVLKETKTEDLITIMVETNYPVPVLSAEGLLVGMVQPGSFMDKWKKVAE